MDKAITTFSIPQPIALMHVSLADTRAVFSTFTKIRKYKETTLWSH